VPRRPSRIAPGYLEYLPNDVPTSTENPEEGGSVE